MQRGFGLLGIVVVGLFALIVGGLAYAAGLAAGQAGAAGAASGTVVYAFGWWHPFGFVFGFFFFLLIMFVLFRAIAGPRRWGGHGGWGYGGPGWGPGGPTGQDFAGRDVPPQFEPMLQKWHQRAHGDPAGAPPASGSGSAEPPASPPR